jgi:metal-responsive CopG/Arc/MetJ family transcriptional regulator
MKAVQITLDERLLAELDADDEVKRDGRSAVLRRAATEYLRRKRSKSIEEAYRRGYGSGVDDLSGWPDQGVWPEE